MMVEEEACIVGSLIGHQGRCFDLRIHPFYYDLLLSSSEDGNAKLWRISEHKNVHTLLHNKEAEVLRSSFIDNLVATAGSDGAVQLWDLNIEPDNQTRSFIAKRGNFPEISSANKEPATTKQFGSISSKNLGRLNHDGAEAQIYVCEPSPYSSSSLLTAADSKVYLWDINTCQCTSNWHYSDLKSNTNSDSSSSEIKVFGGDRNPDNEVFVFDAKWNPTKPHEAILALSDSSIRILDSRKSDASIFDISLISNDSPSHLGHATSVRYKL